MHAHEMPLNGKWKGTEDFTDFNSRSCFNREHFLGFPIYPKLRTSFILNNVITLVRKKRLVIRD